MHLSLQYHSLSLFYNYYKICLSMYLFIDQYIFPTTIILFIFNFSLSLFLLKVYQTSFLHHSPFFSFGYLPPPQKKCNNNIDYLWEINISVAASWYNFCFNQEAPPPFGWDYIYGLGKAACKPSNN